MYFGIRLILFIIRLTFNTSCSYNLFEKNQLKYSKYNFTNTKQLALNVANLIYHRYEMHNKTLLQFFQISSNIAKYELLDWLIYLYFYTHYILCIIYIYVDHFDKL
jgi:hypothetical protein